MKHSKKTRRLPRLVAVVAVLAVAVCVTAFLMRGHSHSTPASTPTVTTTTTKAQPVTESSRAEILVTGDLLMHMPVINSGRSGSDYCFDGIFSYIKGRVSSADFAVANLETTLAGTENGRTYTGYPRFNCPDAITDAVKNAGFDMLLTANNHCNDTGAGGFTRTQDVVKNSGLLHLGTKLNATDPDYTVQEINGIKVGMVCYTYGTINDTTGQKAVNGLSVSKTLTDNINVFDYNKLDRFYGEMETLIATMRGEGAEAIVLFIHWGNEYQTKHNSAQETIAQAMCDLGVDVIAGGHPHVVQDVALLSGSTNPEHKTLCAYSLGNAVSNQRSTNMNLSTGHTEDGALFSFTFVKYTNGEVHLEDAEFLPTWVYIRRGSASKSYDILPLDVKVTDWKTAYNLGDTTYNQAQASYERTQKVLGSGLSDAVAALAQDKSLREAAFANAAG